MEFHYSPAKVDKAFFEIIEIHLASLSLFRYVVMVNHHSEQ